MRSFPDPFREGAVAAGARRRRSLAIALMLVLFAALIFAVTAVRLVQNINARPPATGQPASAAPSG
jgi:hypothetical protein